jgi:copper chaperone CopZ
MKKLVLSIFIATLFPAAVTAGTIEMKVYGLVCGFCAQGIEKTLRKNPATADVLVSLENQLVAVETREGADLSDAELTKALTDSGYDVKGIERTTRSLADIRNQLGRDKK